MSIVIMIVAVLFIGLSLYLFLGGKDVVVVENVPSTPDQKEAKRKRNLYIIGCFFVLTSIVQVFGTFFGNEAASVPICILYFLAGMGLLTGKNSARQFAIVLVICDLLLAFFYPSLFRIAVNTLFLVALLKQPASRARPSENLETSLRKGINHQKSEIRGAMEKKRPIFLIISSLLCILFAVIMLQGALSGIRTGRGLTPDNHYGLIFLILGYGLIMMKNWARIVFICFTIVFNIYYGFIVINYFIKPSAMGLLMFFLLPLLVFLNVVLIYLLNDKVKCLFIK